MVGTPAGPTTTFNVADGPDASDLTVNSVIRDHPGFEGRMRIIKTGDGRLVLTNGGNSNSAANLASAGGGGDADGSEGGSTLDRRKASMYVKNRANMQKGTR